MIVRTPARITLTLVGALVALTPAARAEPAATPSPHPSAAASPETLATIEPMTEDKRIKADDIDNVMKDPKIFFLDVREPKEIEELGAYEGYVNIPMSQLESRLGELPRDRPILTA
jgi:hypothetical protein